MIRIAGVLPLHTRALEIPNKRKKAHTSKEGKIDAVFGKPTKLDFFVEVSGLKPTPGFSLPIKLRFLQELEDEQQKEHALTEVRGSVLFFLSPEGNH